MHHFGKYSILLSFFISIVLILPVVNALDMSFFPQVRNPVFRGCEPSLIMSENGTWVDCWYSGGSGYTKLYYARANINGLGSFVGPHSNEGIIVLEGIRFPTVVKDENTYYLFASKDPNGQDDIWMWTSTDKVTWTPANGGTPVMYQTADSDSPWHTMWNCGVVVIDHVFHMFVECATYDGTYNQNGVRLGYTYAPVDDVSKFMVYRTQNMVIDKGGSPCPIYVPDRNAIMLFYSTLNTTIGQWHLSMATASLSDDLSSSKNWHISDSFRVIDYNNGADPAFCVVPNGQHNLVYLWFHGQPIFNDIYEEFSDASLNDFFDTEGQPLIHGSGPNIILSILPFIMAGILSLVFSVVTEHRISVSIFLIVFAMMLSILAAINAIPIYTIVVSVMLYALVVYMKRGSAVNE